MRILLLMLALLLPGASKPAQESVLDQMKVVYCYERFSSVSGDVTTPSSVRVQAKQKADTLFLRYQRALEESKGELTEIALQEEAVKARAARSRGLSTAEFFMVSEGCDRVAQTGDR
jgi:hypothetical protein